MLIAGQTSEQTKRQSIDIGKILYIVILILAIVTRLIWLGDRATSHDETTHAKYSWNFYAGRGFRHDPLMHGPLLFEITGLFYFLFGVNDFTARLYTALTGIALVMTPILFRKWLGRLCALLASVLLLISPAITYYSRYTRHDIPMILAAFLFLWAVFSYIEKGNNRYLYFMAGFFAFMFASKENAYIYTAIFLIALALPFMWWLLSVPWSKPRLLSVLIAIVIVALLAGGFFILSLRNAETVAAGEGNNEIGAILIPGWGKLAAAIVFVSVIAGLLVAVDGVGRQYIQGMRLFDVLLITSTFTLPLGSALLMKFIVGVDMTLFYPAVMSMNFEAVPLSSVIGAFTTLVAMLILSVGLGLWWNRHKWPGIAIVFYAVFFIFYSSLFTWGWGMVTGLVGGLAYWIAQQDVQRGSQPWYYYAFIGPLYEYLPILFSLLAAIPAVNWVFRRVPSEVKISYKENPENTNIDFNQKLLRQYVPVFLVLWAMMSWVAYAVAGEKMPWLFVHIAFPHILLAAWGLGQWFKDLTLDDIVKRFGWLVPTSLFFLWQAVRAFRKSTGALQTFQESMAVSGASEGLSQLLSQLDPIARFIGGLGGVFLCSVLLVWALDKADRTKALRLVLLGVFIIIAGFTVRTMVMLNYINSELATEFLVYAHATPDVNVALEEIERLSWRVTGTPDEIKVAYGKEVAWPFYWYMDTRFPNNYYYFDNPDPEKLLECPVIVSAKQEWADVSEITGVDYIHFDYKHIWWPIEDYKDLTWERVYAALTDAEMRKALWEIILNRDYRRYAQIKNPENPFTYHTWPHRLEFRLYIRKDLARDLWSYRVGGDTADLEFAMGEDDFSSAEMVLEPDANIQLPSGVTGDLAVLEDGSFYIVDKMNHRILHVSQQGDVLHTLGGYGADDGEFNEPWGLDVDRFGNLYVADTWNHRIQKFDPNGEHVRTWGRFGQSSPFDLAGQGAFYGPRDVAVGPDERLYVTDTGNNRIQVFDTDGNYAGEFGGTGGEPGLFSEPVGIAVDENGDIFIADTWNQRVQVFSQNSAFLRSWEINSWLSEIPDAKPYLAGENGYLFAVDPLGHRILAFSTDGAYLWALKADDDTQIPSGVDILNGRLYVVDSTSELVNVYDLSWMIPE